MPFTNPLRPHWVIHITNPTSGSDFRTISAKSRCQGVSTPDFAGQFVEPGGSFLYPPRLIQAKPPMDPVVVVFCIQSEGKFTPYERPIPIPSPIPPPTRRT
jgi:hypothetical protein